jgi:TolA-binding protein
LLISISYSLNAFSRVPRRDLHAMRRLRFFAILWTVALPALLSLGTPLRAGENEDLNFAKKLRRDGMYVAAAEEFLRFTDKYPQSVFCPEALFTAAESYLQAAKANDALGIYERFIETYPNDERACLARLQRGKIFKALKRYKEGADELLLIPDENPACPVIDQALLDAAECLMSMGDSEGAAQVLRRIINERKESPLTARARYTLALVLINRGRDLEADKVLADVVSMYPSSPVRALALVKLGERALAAKDYAKAEGYFRTVEKDFKEDPLAEKAVYGLIVIQSEKGDASGVVTQSERFLDRFPESELRPTVLRMAIEAALTAKKPDKALALVSVLKAGKAMPDSTGEMSLLTARVLGGAGKVNEAIGELEAMRRDHPTSPLLTSALVLEGELRDAAGAPLEAARLYNLALMGTASRDERLMIDTRLAELSAARLGDTLSAMRYWRLVADEDKDGAAGEKALYAESALRERIGDIDGATSGYEAVVSRFPGGTYAPPARERLRVLSLLPVWNADVGRRLARIAAWDAGVAQRSLETGVILVEGARDADAAVPVLEGALSKELSDSLRAKGSYYLGKARLMRSQASLARGESAASERSRGLELLDETAKKYANSVWGERARREYIEQRASEWSLPERLGKIEEYLTLYGTGDGRWWGLTKRAQYLSERGLAGDTIAARAALAASSEVLSSNAPIADKKEATLLGASLLRASGDNAGAARLYGSFVSTYGDDPRITAALYDLGEALLASKDYVGAAGAYDRCLARAPARDIAETCTIRKGDCLYYRGMFAEAAAAYAAFAAQAPESPLADEAVFREALAKDRLGEEAEVDAMLEGLLQKRGVARDVGLRASAWRATRLLERGDYGKAKPLLESVAAAERSAANLTLAGEAELGAKDYAAAARSFSGALGCDKADTCRALAGRAKSYLRLKDRERAQADISLLENRCAASKGVAGVALERGIIETEEGRCDEAASSLGDVRTRYQGTEEGAEALYYLALCDLKRGGYAEAADKIETFLTESPHSPILAQAYFKLASAQYGAGNLNLAVKNYGLAAEAAKDPELSYAAWKNLGGVYQRMEKWDDAAATWQKLVELFPGREGIVESLFDLGFCYSQAGRNELAYDVYVRIPDVATNEEQQGRAHYWAGMSLKSLGRYDDAIREFLRVPYLKTGGMWGVTSKLEAAGCYERTGAVGQAEKIYRDVIAAQGAASDWGRVATEGLERIGKKQEAGTGENKTGEHAP